MYTHNSNCCGHMVENHVQLNQLFGFPIVIPYKLRGAFAFLILISSFFFVNLTQNQIRSVEQKRCFQPPKFTCFDCCFQQKLQIFCVTVAIGNKKEKYYIGNITYSRQSKLITCFFHEFLHICKQISRLSVYICEVLNHNISIHTDRIDKIFLETLL